MTSLNDAFLHELKDVLSAEKQLTRALPKMARKAVSPELKQAFETHLDETKGQIERLEKVFATVDRKPTSSRCEAMAGIIEEGQSVMEEDADDTVMDALLIGAAQKAEHYEIATYGTLVNWANTLGLKEAADLLRQNEMEEAATDKKLTTLARKINKSAANGK